MRLLRSLIRPLVVVIVVVLHSLNAPIFLSLPGDMTTVHSQAGACDEGQKEDALGDEEATERVAVLLPTVC